MRVFLDENMPRALRQVLDAHDVSFVEKEGWKGKQNGGLLSLVEVSFDVMVTSDANIEFQNELSGRSLSFIILPTNNLTLLRANAIAVRNLLNELAAFDHHVLVVVDWKGSRRMRRLTIEGGQEVELPPVSSFGSPSRKR